MATMQFEYDPERLIEEVKRRPGLWDFEDIDYRTKAKRHKLWAEVVHELMTSDVKVTKSELRELELQLQKKWKSIRDCFQKYISHPERTKRPYIYTRQLQFLLKHQGNQSQQQTGEGSGDSDDGRIKKKAWKPRKKLKLSKDSSDDDNGAECTDEFISNDDTYLDISKHNNSSKQNYAEDFAFASVDSQSRNEQEDPDKMFLLSLLPHLKSIPEEMRLNVKLDLMQVLRNANYNMPTEHKIF